MKIYLETIFSEVEMRPWIRRNRRINTIIENGIRNYATLA